MADWQKLPADLPDLFPRLRALVPAEVCVRFATGARGGGAVEVPCAVLLVQGALAVRESVDRFAVEVPSWGAGDFAWFARRRGRGRPDYWQAAIEHHPRGRPALVLYLTAPPDGLEISVQRSE